MAALSDIVKYLNKELDIHNFKDSSLNGLQVEGQAEVNLIGVAVDSGLSVLEEAINKGVNLLIVHHGIFWDRSEKFVGSLKKAIEMLIASKMSLYAAHLPLDAHVFYGNNYCLARLLDLTSLASCIDYHGRLIACKGVNRRGHSLEEFKEVLGALPGNTSEKVQVLPFGQNPPNHVAVISGSGADALFQAEREEFDTIITGEPRQFAYHYAKDHNLNAIFAGHYATETVGIRELGKITATKFALKWLFIDHPTGI